MSEFFQVFPAVWALHAGTDKTRFKLFKEVWNTLNMSIKTVACKSEWSTLWMTIAPNCNVKMSHFDFKKASF